MPWEVQRMLLSVSAPAQGDAAEMSLTCAADAAERVELRLQQARVVQVLWPFIASFVSRLSHCWHEKEPDLTQCGPLQAHGWRLTCSLTASSTAGL